MRLLRPCGLIIACVLAAPSPAHEQLPAVTQQLQLGDTAAALALIAADADVNAAQADGSTPLHWAAHYAHNEVLRELLRAGADPSATNRYGMTALHLAAVNGDEAGIRLLLEAGADANAALPEGETPLMSAARTGRPAAVAALLEHGARTQDREHWYGETALIWAAANDHGAAVQTLIAGGADVDVTSNRHEPERRRVSQALLPLGEWTPLMYAARQNALSAGAALLQADANPDIQDPDGATALTIAIINAHYDFALLLLDGGADPNLYDTAGMGPLYAAVDMHRLNLGHGRPLPLPVGDATAVDVVRALLEAGADPNAALTGVTIQRQHTFGDFSLAQGATPLLRAAKSGDIAILHLLVEHGADPLHRMPDGTNALMYAAGLGWRDGSPIAPSFDQGPVEEAIASIDLLLAHGLTTAMQSDNGETVLHAAATGRKAPEIVGHLIALDPSLLNVRNNDGQTPLDRATARRPDPTVVELLEAAMAEFSDQSDESRYP